MAWLQVHQSLPHHRKTLVTAKRLGVHRAQAAGHLVFLWLWALDNAPDGRLTGIDADILADAAMWPGDPDLFLDVLAQAGFLERDGDGFIIHDWAEYAGRLIQQRRAATKRTQAWREQHNEGVTGEDVTHNERITNAPVMDNERARYELEKSRVENNIHPTDGAKKAPPSPDSKNERTLTHRQAVFAALASVCNYDRDRLTKEERGEINNATKSLVDARYSPLDVQKMAGNWERIMGDCTMTPSALAKHATRLLRPPSAAARAAPVDYDEQQRRFRESLEAPL